MKSRDGNTENEALGRPTLRAFLGERQFRLLTNSTEVLVYRLEPIEPNPHFDERAPGTMHGYPILRELGPATPEQVKRVQDLVHEKWRREQDGVPSACLFAAGVGFRFQGRDGELDLLLCFKCVDWTFYGPDKKRVESFAAVESEAIELVKGLFPGDDVVQSLQPRSSR